MTINHREHDHPATKAARASCRRSLTYADPASPITVILAEVKGSVDKFKIVSFEFVASFLRAYEKEHDVTFVAVSNDDLDT